MRDDLNSFGTVLKDVRAALGLSQATLAMTLGSTQRHLSFLETGRSAPTRSFVSRICRELELSVAQRANLFEASGHPNPYPARDLSSDEVSAALDMIEARVLENWPFPALVLDSSWNVLRANKVFGQMFGALLPSGNAAPNLLKIFLSPLFRSLITNWEDAASVLFFRLQSAAAHDETIRDLFTRARSENLFPDFASKDVAVPVFQPLEITLPGGPTLQMTSLLGKLASTQDALVDGFEIELMIPTDAASEAVMRGLLG